MTSITLKGRPRLILFSLLSSLAVGSAVFLIVVFAQMRDTGCAGRYEKPPCGPGVEMGKPYSYTMFTHCGIRRAYFDGRQWVGNPMLSWVGNPPPPWSTPFDRGKMELVTEDLARFTSSGGVVTKFRPLPEGAEFIWGICA